MEQSEAVSKKGHKRKSSADRQVHKPNWKECVASQEEIKKLQVHNLRFQTARLEAELVQLYFRQPVGVEGGMFMLVARALQIVSANISQKLSAVYLGRAFNDLGFKSVKYRGQRGYVVELRTGDEVQRLQRKMVDECDVDSGQQDSTFLKPLAYRARTRYAYTFKFLLSYCPTVQ